MHSTRDPTGSSDATSHVGDWPSLQHVRRLFFIPAWSHDSRCNPEPRHSAMGAGGRVGGGLVDLEGVVVSDAQDVGHCSANVWSSPCDLQVASNQFPVAM